MKSNTNQFNKSNQIYQDNFPKLPINLFLPFSGLESGHTRRKVCCGLLLVCGHHSQPNPHCW